jgi:G3E family GTPase
VVATVDAVNGLATLAAHQEALKQAAVADEIVVTKTDLAADPDATARLAARVKALNPGARLHVSRPDCMPLPSELTTTDIYDPATKSADALAWLNAEAFSGDAGHGHGHHHHDVNRHDQNIGSFCLTYTEPLDWEHVAAWLDALVMAHGADLLRVKGILEIAGEPRPVVLQAVQHLFHPPAVLPAWPTAERQSQIVFITRGLTRAYVAEVLDTVRQRRPARARP